MPATANRAIEPGATRKLRQHHVWQNYLRGWTDKGKIFCLSDKKIFNTDTKNVAVERDFYRLQPLTDEDIAFLKLFVIDTGPEYSRSVHEKFLGDLLLPRAFGEQHRHKLKNRGKVESYLLAYETNALENYHMGIESSFARILSQLRKGDVSFYSDDTACIMFARYIATQYMRTKGIKVRVIERFRHKMGVDLSRLWDIASMIQATNIGCSLFMSRKRQQLVLLLNSTNEEFITGDQPAINLHSGNKQEPPTKLSLYYPISPTIALIWGEVDEMVPYSSDTLTASQVFGFNARIAAEAHSQVFGYSAHSLKRYL
jgi:hypothetical protein